MASYKEEGIHNVIVPATPVAAVAFFVMLAAQLSAARSRLAYQSQSIYEDGFGADRFERQVHRPPDRSGAMDGAGGNDGRVPRD